MAEEKKSIAQTLKGWLVGDPTDPDNPTQRQRDRERIRRIKAAQEEKFQAALRGEHGLEMQEKAQAANKKRPLSRALRGMKKGGLIKSSRKKSKSIDGIARKGKTRAKHR